MLQLLEGSKTYRGAEGVVVALRSTTLELEPGQFIAVMGRSGSGKSTLMRLLAGVEAPDTGELVVDGETISTAAARTALRRGVVACIYQDYNLVPELTLRENITLAQRLAGRAAVAPEEALSRIGVGALAGRYPHQVSGGEQQRGAVARALAVGARYIVADEPTGALDEENAQRLAQAFRAAAEAGAGVLTMTHDQLLARSADEIWRLKEQRLQCAG